ncbi:imm11 family protein [Nioella sp. MMSF_3534]|uniref:imm11 family protein n=1 Tax=Nioella sp. MMSF_3534 TaxID=3046720 RepID=UPI00273DB918|nr:DUF1629 domain-containing protein [Nioella sp. MMSF_3534]
MTWVFNRSVNDNVLIAGWFLEAQKPHPDWSRYLDVSIVLGEGTRSLSADEMPRQFFIDEKPRALPDMFMGSSGKWVVSDPARQIIEDLDPGLHQFFSINVQFPDGSSPLGEWFAMNITTVRKTMIDAESAIKHLPPAKLPKKLPDGTITTYWSTGTSLIDFNAKRITVGPDADDGANLWREKGHQRDLILFSDKLHDALQEAGLTTAKTFRARLSTES